MKEDQRVILTKRLLQEGILRLLQKEELGKISVTELCAESGVNRATFYRHYQQPRDIIVDIRHNLFNRVKLFEEKNRSAKDPKKWLEGMCQYFYEHAEILKVLFRCRTDEEFVGFINELYQSYFQQLRDAGYGLALDDDDLKLTTYFFAGGIYYILRQWITEPILKTPQEVARVIYRFISTNS